MPKNVDMPVQDVTRTGGLLPRPPEISGDHANGQALARTDGLLPRPPEKLPACSEAMQKFVTLCGKPDVYAALLEAGWRP